MVQIHSPRLIEDQASQWIPLRGFFSPVPADVLPKADQDLAVIRQAVEREVWRIWTQRMDLGPLGGPPLPPRPFPQTAEQAAQELSDKELLPRDLARAAQMVMWFGGPRPPGDLPDLPRADQERFVRDVGWTVVQRLKNQNWGRIFPTGGNLLP